MHKKTTFKGIDVFLLKAVLTTLIFGFIFQFSFAQKQAANASKPAPFPNKQQKIAAAKPAPALTKEQIKANPKLAENNSVVTATFSDAVKNEPALKAQTEARDNTKKSGAVKAAENSTPAAAPSSRTAAEIEKKKALHKSNGN